jgi:hypothetical protein
VLVEHELVAHLFAPLSGPDAEAAVACLASCWAACRDELGMTRGIAEAGLSARWPSPASPPSSSAPVAFPEGPLAGLQDPAGEHQAILRRERDALNLSLVMAPLGSPAPTWHALAGRWRLLAPDPTPLLGAVLIFQAKSAEPPDLRTQLPPRDDDARSWSTIESDGFTIWETTPTGDRTSRRLVVLAPPAPDADARLSRFTWSAGDTALPPLGRYLLHAAWLRYHARVRGDGTALRRLHEPDAAAFDLADTLSRLRLMRRAVEITRANMAAALDPPLPTDAALADWLTAQLSDDTEHLSAVQDRLHSAPAAPPAPPTLHLAPPPLPDVAPPVPEPLPGVAPSLAPEPVPGVAPPPVPGVDSSPVPGRVEFRMVFGVDVIGYSDRPAPEQDAVQSRVSAQIDRVLTRLGVPAPSASLQPSGDGMMVVLPTNVELHRALPALLHGWRAVLAEDNAAHPGHRIRLRLSATAGPIATASMGFSGGTIVEAGRLLDAPPLREAASASPSADVVTMISDRLHQDVIREGHPGLPATEFAPREVQNKTYKATAWLWTGPA